MLRKPEESTHNTFLDGTETKMLAFGRKYRIHERSLEFTR